MFSSHLRTVNVRLTYVPSLLNTASTRAFAAAAAPSPASSATTPNTTNAAAPGVTVRFPLSKAYLARLAAEKLKQNPPPRAPKVMYGEPRHFKRRNADKIYQPMGEAPQRSADGTVPWKISRLVTGQLPVSVERARMETSREYLVLSQISGDVKSLVSEIELFVGPLYDVKANTVDTEISIKPTPKSKVNEAFVDKFKQWLIKIGV